MEGQAISFGWRRGGRGGSSGGWRGGVGGFGLRELDVGDFLEEFGFAGPVVGLESGAMLRLEEKMADVGEGGGAAGGDAVGGKGLEEFAEDVIDVDLGDEIAGWAGEFAAEIVFAVEGAAVDGGVVEAKSVVLGMRGHAAAFAVGEGKGAEVVGGVWASVTHRQC